ncbi:MULTISPECIES: hypothetical protein [Cyanophyceae]|uniref:Uncharacterized protein n=1 Tax=Nodularia spumigena CENA596 TaxID=1819295 RepID=A0A166JJP4_NODSP|nr:MULTISPECIES: hypothetical protein [Cyanophyceae]MDB9355142.1 hypothetical protein [Nodularia spumigena CS-587/03]KZL49792.1 hypothetical protein A2T98_11065 [Nodularia spumigena CENA596]MDB9305431.1 hypothetical protein [Nodularia spumigena CS-591/12]MDB9320218.1 hypothetical protein [Nodularia spumigena CS-590/01A]MDB9320902.1 hypothetical protein [Nodularia spumigena CS-591/07A]
MKYLRPRHHFRGNFLVVIIVAITATPAIGETSLFGTFSLSPGFEPAAGIVTGNTGGSYSLSNISRRDRDRNACVGFADPQPDHILKLEEDFDRLNIQVNSGGYDTTLLIQGPDDNTIRCGDDTGTNKDASIDDKNWKSGTYRISVGTFNPGMRRNYTLTVQEK